MPIHFSSLRVVTTYCGYSLGCVALLFLSGCPFAGPTAAFTATPTEGDAPLAVAFIDQSVHGDADITSWLWDFGDGTQSVDQSPAHTYTANGLYRVTLRVSSTFGVSTETKDAFINVRAVPDAAFTASPQTGNTPLTVQFEDQSTAAPFSVTAWRWTFGDGEVSEEQHPTHVYEQPGQYTVSLTVRSDGGSNTETRNAFIRVAEEPTVTFEASRTVGPAPLSVTFTDTSLPGSTPIETWAWNFGDGGTSADQHPTHTFQTPGIYAVSLTARNAAGEKTTRVDNLITVTEAPTAAFSAAPRSGGTPIVVSFVDESIAGSAPITDWLWDFGDGTSSVQQNPIHEFTESGLFDVSLTVTSAHGENTVNKLDFVTANAGPTAAFNASVTRGTVPLSVEFFDTSTAGASPISGRQWSFGDTGTSGEANPVHVYTTPGIYTVSLRVQTGVGSDAHVEQAFIEVVSTPDANFSADTTIGESPLTVVFSDTSVPGTSPIDTWLWDFGDGTTSDMQNPTRVYTNVGTYTVKLTVTTEEGSNTETRIDYVRVQKRPVADFTTNVTAGPAPLTAQFRDHSDAGSETITGRVWDFGDGTTSTAEDPVHTYTAPGTYTVALNLSTTSGPVSAQKSNLVVVAPAIAFTASPDSNRAPAFVSFTDTSNTGTLEVLSRSWDFGDGQTSAALNPVHQYTAPGSYSVTLTITTVQGESHFTRDAVVRLRPTPQFEGAPRAGAGGPFAVQFQDMTDPGSLGITGWDWNFGDGQHSALQNPGHTFAKPGLYAVSLTIQTEIGNTITTKESYISIRPAAAFSASATSGEDSLAVAFTDTTDPGNLSILSWLWSFGDGGSSTIQNPSHRYERPGTYTVKLTTTSSEGSDSATRVGLIKVEPRVRFGATTVSGTAPLEVTFTDQTDPGTLEISARSWSLGEGDPVMEDRPTFTYETPGLYDVALTITTAQGDKTLTRPGFITVLPVLSAMTEITMGTGTATVAFTNTSETGEFTGATWLWDFGDGTTSTELSPTHTYTTPGLFNPTLTITTAEGVSATTNVATISIDPIPSFSANVLTGDVPLTVQFTDTSNIGNLTITGWAWDFGDSGTSTLENPEHTFTEAGSFEVSLSITTALGTVTTATPTTLMVIPAPDFSASPSNGAPTLSVAFTNTTNLGGATLNSVLWNFGDGGSSTDASPSHDYTTPGTYPVTLTINTSEGTATETKTDFIAVNPIPSFSTSATSGGAPFTINFTDTSTLGSVVPTGYAWDFGDGDTSTAQNPSHTYLSAGQYTVSLTILSSQGQVTTTETNLVTVSPNVQMSTSHSSGPAPLTVTLTDTTLIGNLTITDWMWDFGDGSGTVTTQTNSQSHTYTTPGNYTPSLTIVTAGGSFTGALAAPIMVNPVPAFSADYRSGPGAFTVTFTDDTSGGSVNTTSRAWDFGDGGTTTTGNSSITHTYSTAGTYDVTMTLSTDIQGMLSKTETDYITANPLSYSVSGGTTGTVTHAITVSNTTAASDLPILTTQWNYGDGSAQTPSPNHSYTMAGSFPVSMIVTTVQGSQTFTGPSPIVVGPAITFTTDVDEGPGVLDVLFTDTTPSGSLSVTSRTWNFGDGSSMTINAPTTTISHRYTNTGTTILDREANVTLNTSAGSFEGTTPDTIRIHPINFSGDATNQLPPFTVNFADSTVTGDLSITAWDWDFKDGDTATTGANNTSHLYAEAGLFDVELTITTSQGNMATGTVSSDILIRPVVRYFETSTVQGPAPHTVNFEDQTVVGHLTGITRRWTWGDGTTSDVAAATTSHAFATAGCFDTTMQLVTDQGTFSDNTYTVRVTAQDTTTFTLPTTNNNGQAGVMFDVMALKDLRVTAFSLPVSGGGTSNIRSYVTANSQGVESNAGAWGLLSNTSVTSSSNTTVDIPDVTFSSGDQAGFFLLNTSGNTVGYQSASVDSSYDDTRIRVLTNAGKAIGSTDFNGSTFEPRHFVGSVTYVHTLTCNLKSGGLAILENEYVYDGSRGKDDGLQPTMESEVIAATTQDGGRVAIGQYDANGVDNQGPLLIRTDQHLNTLWELDLTGFAFDEIQGLRVMPNGDLLLSGPTGLNGPDNDLMLLRLDSTGNLLWEQVLDGVDANALRAMNDTRNGDLLVLSAQGSESLGFTPTAHRVDTFSNILWAADFPTVAHDANFGIYERGDGAIEIYGSVDGAIDDHAVWNLRVSSDGAEIIAPAAQ